MLYQTINPYTEEILKTFDLHSDAQLANIITNADATYTNIWRKKSYAERSAVLHRAAELMRHNRDAFATPITVEMGKLFREAQAEVDLSADILDYYADNAEKFLAPVNLQVDDGKATILNQPIGIVFCIEPWNFPYYQLARVVGPNLMAGNVLIVKHAPGVPQCAVMFEDLLADAGAPAGAYSNVFITNEQSATVVADPHVRGVALTGSERAGKAVAAEAGSALKKNTMELGGSDAFIVLDDADLDIAIKWAVWGRMNNTGQCCVAAKRFIVHEKVADTFTARFKAELEKLVAGDPMDEKTTLGPLCSESALKLVLGQIESAVAHGARIVTGGKRIARSGYFIQPTILENINKDNPAFHQEFFAPVAMIFRVPDEQAAIDLANDSPYGLGGSVITTDIERGRHVAAQIETGMVFINRSTWTAPGLPFGGVKNSGYGRELSSLGIEEFINKKLVHTPA
ncbi:NAD-dependent succinate-semialdehyde dehydrogenase [Novacetimonas hansenii]|uniref:NAD-dependent succinate-semialdehyde dehydrogenase n=1 Tax=Novacetimonas hansenii TaxID=436 RepID=UPI000789AC83|nr:NAD-dependent succinate-semialdehyde dehydrogenase [Novacetimonas hansenii]RFP03190.1 succinate-semialdehyde dehydrogenase [Novacetimonas hansenii]WEQ59544.1 NAD-dependent succinate-semialdehyde dehydrogenase [Novacetimonas hansenii]CUW47158.1 Succinate-semialdehyde dehydrogenase [NADP()] 1 [Novacetimonas hansenii]